MKSNIAIESIVDQKTFKCSVIVVLGDKRFILTPEEAINHGQDILALANDALGNQALIAVLKKDLKFNEDRVRNFLKIYLRNLNHAREAQNSQGRSLGVGEGKNSRIEEEGDEKLQ